MVQCSVTQEGDENCDALLGMELGKEVWSIRYFEIYDSDPDLRECKTNLDGSTPRLCRTQRKATLTVE